MTDVETGATGSGAGGRPPRGRPRWLPVVAAILAVLLVGASVAAVMFTLKARADDQEREDRAEAVAVASQFALRMDSVDAADFDGYVKGVNDLLTTKARSENSKVFEAMQQSYQAAKVKGTGKVLVTGVGDYDSDSASVLVVHDADVSTAQGKLQRHYRWTVRMVKVKGDWLVDDFDPAN